MTQYAITKDPAKRAMLSGRHGTEVRESIIENPME